MLLGGSPLDMNAMKYAGHICCVVHEKILLVTPKAQSVFCVVTVCVFVFFMGSLGYA